MEDLLEEYAAVDGVAEDILSDKQQVSSCTSTAHHRISPPSNCRPKGAGGNFKGGQGGHFSSYTGPSMLLARDPISCGLSLSPADY